MCSYHYKEGHQMQETHGQPSCMEIDSAGDQSKHSLVLSSLLDSKRELGTRLLQAVLPS